MKRAKPDKIADCPYASKGGLKLEFALQHFQHTVEGQIIADFGSHQGGFVDCLLQHGAQKVYAVDTCYGTLAWKLRQDPRVEIRERTNAMHWRSPQLVSTITIDVGWTRQHHIIPNAIRNLAPQGVILTLLKPQYEEDKKRKKRVLYEAEVEQIVNDMEGFYSRHFTLVRQAKSPYRGSGGNTEVWFYLCGAKEI